MLGVIYRIHAPRNARCGNGRRLCEPQRLAGRRLGCRRSCCGSETRAPYLDLIAFHAPATIPIQMKTIVLGIDSTKKLPRDGFKRLWLPLIKMDAAVNTKVEKLST